MLVNKTIETYSRIISKDKEQRREREKEQKKQRNRGAEKEREREIIHVQLKLKLKFKLWLYVILKFQYYATSEFAASKKRAIKLSGVHDRVKSLFFCKSDLQL